jgi:hypothetical protein
VGLEGRGDTRKEEVILLEQIAEWIMKKEVILLEKIAMWARKEEVISGRRR